MSDIVLEYHDSILRTEDVALLQDGEWINDAIIDFFYEFLEKTLETHEILYMRPALVHLIAHATDTSDFSSALPSDLPHRQLLFIPVNDNIGEGVGGSHWSLMVFHRNSNTFYYYDSIRDLNLKHAEHTAKRFAKVLKLQEVRFQVMETPQQSNGSDCGIYVISVTELLSKRLLNIIEDKVTYNFEGFWTAHDHEVVQPSVERQRVRNLIFELAREGQTPTKTNP
ncbi:cysteine proteinase [Basidiobolus meristosporus CBS 931.73]|uniref:Cysteine proteinase n=1 Tax=Basidiobolus meristosporus CBS 931.73 TaxID=1314790 RepID=A0A1Y1YAA0_9FUNG|nr:cysteine proteinase [Basidiobolus meristosporus CBS 931.73]|eukprot:ORX94686.1 cysteine proteinase [Basidiobolus meristosporus CBS 931.73]